MLAKHGVIIGDNERLDPAEIMHVLELREELAEARHAADKPKLEALQTNMKQRRAQALLELDGLLRRATGWE